MKLLLLLSLLLLVEKSNSRDTLTSSCGATNNQSYLIKYDPALGGYFSMAVNFLDILHGRTVDYNDVENLISFLVNKDGGDIMQVVKPIIWNQFGFLFAVVCGLILFVVIPVFGCLFCFLRCCGCCGGKMFQPKPTDRCCYCLYAFCVIIYIIIVIGIILFMLSAMESFRSSQYTGQSIVHESTTLARFVSDAALDITCETVDIVFKIINDFNVVAQQAVKTIFGVIDEMTKFKELTDFVIQLNNANGEMQTFHSAIEKLNTSAEEFRKIFLSIITVLHNRSLSNSTKLNKNAVLKELKTYIDGIESLHHDFNRSKSRLDEFILPDFYPLEQKLVNWTIEETKGAKGILQLLEEQAERIAREKVNQTADEINDRNEKIRNGIDKEFESVEKEANKTQQAAVNAVNEVEEKVNKTRDRVHDVSNTAYHFASEKRKTGEKKEAEQKNNATEDTTDKLKRNRRKRSIESKATRLEKASENLKKIGSGAKEVFGEENIGKTGSKLIEVQKKLHDKSTKTAQNVGSRVEEPFSNADDNAQDASSKANDLAGKAKQGIGKVGDSARDVNRHVGSRVHQGAAKAGSEASKLTEQGRQLAQEQINTFGSQALQGANKGDIIIARALKNLQDEFGTNDTDEIIETIGYRLGNITEDAIDTVENFLAAHHDDINNTYNAIQEAISDAMLSWQGANETLALASKKLKKILMDVQLSVFNKTVVASTNAERAMRKSFDGMNQIAFIPGIIFVIPLILPLLCAFCGLCCGAIGFRKIRHPTKRIWISNCGGNCLLIFVFFAALMTFFYIVYTILLFIFGYILQLFCLPIFVDPDLSLYDYLSDKYTKNISYGENWTYSIDIHKVINQCERDAPIYDALELDTPLGPTLNYTLDLVENALEKIPVGKLDEIITSSIVLKLPEDVKDKLDSLKGPFETFGDTLRRRTTQKFLNLPPLHTGKTFLKLQNISKTYPVIGKNVSHLEKQFIILTDSLFKAKTASFILPSLLEKIIEDINYLVKDPDVNKIVKEAQNASNNILSEVEVDFSRYILQLRHDLQHSLVRCRPVYEVWKNTGTAMCKQFAWPIHGMWFALGWIIFFLLILMCLSVRLAKYLRRMKRKWYPEFFDDISAFDSEDDVTPDNKETRLVRAYKHYLPTPPLFLDDLDRVKKFGILPKKDRREDIMPPPPPYEEIMGSKPSQTELTGGGDETA